VLHPLGLSATVCAGSAQLHPAAQPALTGVEFKKKAEKNTTIINNFLTRHIKTLYLISSVKVSRFPLII
jgi:hypothetical protein